MNDITAIAIKQTKDMYKNKAVLIQFLMLPVMALVLTELVAGNETLGIPHLMFVNMFAAMFTGMILVTVTAGVIAEDREHKSLRFLVMAGVKPGEYLAGIGAVMLAASLVVTVFFGLIGGLTLLQFGRFMALMLLSAAASITLGAVLGMASKNQQAATGLALPVSMVLGFSPMIGMFSDTVKTIFTPFYTMQASLALDDLPAGIGRPVLIIAANIGVLVALFAVVYKRAGLRN